MKVELLNKNYKEVATDTCYKEVVMSNYTADIRAVQAKVFRRYLRSKTDVFLQVMLDHIGAFTTDQIVVLEQELAARRREDDRAE